MGNTSGIRRNGVTSSVHTCVIKKHKEDNYEQAEAMRADNGTSCSLGIQIYSINAALDQWPRA